MTTAIRFSEADLELFAAASGDRNPLHLSDAYASRTAYGQRVVFGALGAIAALGYIPAGLRVQRIAAEFLRPMFLHVDYRVEIAERDGVFRVRLFDGSVRVLSLSVTTSAGANDADSDRGSFLSVPPHFERSSAFRRAGSQLQPDSPASQVEGSYASNRQLLASLQARWGGSISPGALELLCFYSYLIGMELPGETALFFKLAADVPAWLWTQALSYRAKVTSVNAAMGHLGLRVELLAGGRTVSTAECGSFTRPSSSPEPPSASQVAQAQAGSSLNGRVVAIIGMSRGLGAALKTAFEARGARVFGISRSGATGDAGVEIGDGADVSTLERLRNRISRETGGIDVLICNACPPILPLRLEPNALNRLDEYIARAVRLALAPLCTFLGDLDASGGTLIVISSSAVSAPVREWPHYIAAKNAVEALARTAPLQYPRVASLIVRPEKLMTELIGTPVGRLGAISPAFLAEQLASLVALADLLPGQTEIFPKAAVTPA